MPEALVIALAVIIGAIWILAKIGEGIVAFIDAATKDYDAAAARRKQNRYSRHRNNLGKYVQIVIPNKLDGFEKNFERVRKEFEQAQKLTRWNPSHY